MTGTGATPVLITGMHRSGTSPVAAMLLRAGVHMGKADDLLPATAYNPHGCWENGLFVEFNDRVLKALGATWDCPPPDEWPHSTILARLRRQASSALDELVRDGPAAGWKDPRTSLTLPFWRDIVDDVRVVVCLRHPRGVAGSLQRWGVSPLRSAELWRIYNERLLAATAADERLVVHHEQMLDQPLATLGRLIGFLGLEPEPDAERSAIAALRDTAADQWGPQDVPRELSDLYGRLCKEAGMEPVRGRRPKFLMSDLVIGRAEEIAGRSTTIGGPGPSDANGNGRPHGTETHTATVVPPAASAVDARLDELTGAVARLEAVVVEQSAGLGRLLESVYSSVADGRRDADRDDQGSEDDYGCVVRRVHDRIRDLVPLGATVSVISRGDPELVRLFGRDGWHFPRQLDGRYAGYHPKNSAAAVVHLETQKAMGAEYLVLPAPSLWWLESYPGFERYLATRCRQVLGGEDRTGRVYSLVEPPERDDGTLAVADMVRRLSTIGGSDPAILDLTDDSRVAAALGGDHDVLALPSPVLPLPYVDASFDVVAVPRDSPLLAAEGRRLASAEVVTLGEGPTISATPAASLPSVSMIVPAWNKSALTRAFLGSLRATLPSRFCGEVIVVDDASTDDTPALLDHWEREWEQLRVVTNTTNLGYLQSLLAGIDVAKSEYYLFLNNDMVMLPGWFEPLLATFRDFPDAGVVGGRLVYPDGILQEAGGIVFADGSAAKYGYSDADLDHPAYNHVRQVDYCSGCLLLTPRAVFDDVGGIDRSFDPGYYEDTDYCLRVRLSGRQVYYQPESTVVHLEGGTAGIDTNVGMKRHQMINQRRFVEKWGPMLARTQPARPQPADIASLHDLVLRGAQPSLVAR